MTRPRPGARALALGLLAGSALDALLPDPRRHHPVALFGNAAATAERYLYDDSRTRGAAHTAVCVGAAVGLGVAARRTGALGVAVGTWAVLGGRSLRTEGRAVADLLAAGDLDGARRQVTHLVGRDPSVLDADGVARAALESVAENTCDAVVAPLFWGAVAGLPGLLGYRAVNTLDAMVGHRSPRYANFGAAAARLDDAANWLPARASSMLVAAAAPAVGGSAGRAAATALRDARRHPSPNSGWSEAAFAGALGVRVGGRNVYQGRVEDRPVLGDGRAVAVPDLARATRLSAAVTVLATAAAAVLARSRRATFGGFRRPGGRNPPKVARGVAPGRGWRR